MGELQGVYKIFFFDIYPVILKTAYDKLKNSSTFLELLPQLQTFISRVSARNQLLL